MTTVLLISGMCDNGCRERITEALEHVVGVREVNVNLYRARATIVHDASCDPRMLLGTVVEAGCAASLQVERSKGGAAAKRTKAPGHDA